MSQTNRVDGGMSPETVSIKLTEKQIGQLALSATVAGIAGVIPKDEAWELVDSMYSFHVKFIRDTFNGKE